MTAESATPRRPPAPVSDTASVRNWRTMSRRRAPRALRTPISRVRSVTLTSMMFMTPMPPTRRPRAEMEVETRMIMPMMRSSCWMIESAVEMAKLLMPT